MEVQEEKKDDGGGFKKEDNRDGYLSVREIVGDAPGKMGFGLEGQ